MPEPVRSRFYYGWVIVMVALAMNFASAPATAVTFGFFIRPMGDDLGWSSGALALGLTFRLAVAGVTAPLLGSLLDRFGARGLGSVAALVAGLSIMAVGFVHDRWVFYLLSAISGLSGFGGPAGQLLTVVPVAKWFQARRGRALAIATMGTPAGNLVLIPLAQLLIDLSSWRTAWIVLGGMMILVAMPVCALFMRKDPESMGLRIENAPSDPEETQRPVANAGVANDEVSWTSRQAVRSSVFWLVLIATGLAGLVAQGTLVHRVPFWQDTGMASVYVAFGTAVSPLLVVISGVMFGFLAERVAARRIGFFGGVCTGLSVVPMIFGRNSLALLLIHNTLWGIGQGANNTVANIIWPNYFGRQHLGAIRGVVFPVAVGTAAASPPLFALLLLLPVETRWVWIVPAVAFIASGVLFILSKAPARPGSQGRS